MGSWFTLKMTPFFGILAFTYLGEAVMFCVHYEENNHFLSFEVHAS